jgi:hypothetical protein
MGVGNSMVFNDDGQRDSTRRIDGQVRRMKQSLYDDDRDAVVISGTTTRTETTTS